MTSASSLLLPNEKRSALLEFLETGDYALEIKLDVEAELRLDSWETVNALGQ
jgi:hypothetical protein